MITAKLIKLKGNISASEYYAVEVEFNGVPYIFKLSENQYFDINECDDRKQNQAKKMLSKLIDKINRRF